MNVFEKLRAGQSFHVLNDEDYVREAHGEFKRCRHLCWLINSTDPDEQQKIWKLEREMFNGNFGAREIYLSPEEIADIDDKLDTMDFEVFGGSPTK